MGRIPENSREMMLRGSDEAESGSGSDSNDDQGAMDIDDDLEATPDQPGPPEEGIYGMAVASVIIDTRKVLQTQGEERLRHMSRLVLVLLIVFFTLSLQMYITLMTKFIVTPEAVDNLRVAYGSYENIMYSNHTYLTRFGHQRGIDGFFNASKFAEMNGDDQQSLCNFPLAQPHFLIAILLVWTLTCFRYMRKNMTFTHRIWNLSTDVSSMSDDGVFEKDENDEPIVKKITLLAKIFLIAVIQLPTLFMNVLLLWIGSRYLIATVGYGEILLNAIALEFVLMLHELLYFTIVPHSMQTNLGNLRIPHSPTYQQASWFNMFGTFSMLLIAIIWSLCYVYKLESVLPDYRWDIRAVCELKASHGADHGLFS